MREITNCFQNRNHRIALRGAPVPSSSTLRPSFIGFQSAALTWLHPLSSLALALLAGSLLRPSIGTGAEALPAMNCAVVKYLGTTGPNEVMLNRIVANAGAQMGGVHVDTSHTPNRFYVFDSANSRILGFYGFRPPNPDGTFPPADIVIGQPNGWDHGAANGCNTRLNVPPTDRTLALLPFPNVSSTAESPRSGMMATDSQGNLYVTDECNNRVLKFNDPFATDCIADDVWGQTSFTNRYRPGSPTASSLNMNFVFSAGVEVDAANNLWVADSGNSRVLRFPAGSKTADLVLGQSSFTTANTGSGADQMNRCTGVRMHPITGEVFVLDGEEASNGRLLIFTPPFSSGMSAARIIGQASSNDSPDGLHYARGFCFDPQDSNAVWVADGGHRRILKFDTHTGAMLDVIGFNNFTDTGGNNYRGWDGTIYDMGQCDGSISFDSAGSFYFVVNGPGHGVARIPFPLQHDANGYVISDGQMLQAGFNQISGRTMQDHYGMTYANGQLYGASNARLLVWTNAAKAGTFQAADYVIGQSTPDAITAGGTFNGIAVNQMSAGSNWLFAICGSSIFVFQTPFTHGGLNYAPNKILDGGGGTVQWDDDSTSVYFSPTGLAYDAVADALWVSDHQCNRLLRIRAPATTPRVDLVIGQANKTDCEQNHGLGLYSTDERGIAGPWSLALDRHGNLYAVDSGFEGRVDNSGNLRVLRFDAADVVPVPGNIFPNPAASGVFCKANFTDNRDVSESNRPHTPTYVAFDSSNHMVMLCDSYGNPQGQLVFWYPTPDVGVAPQPTQVITTMMGQPAIAAFDEHDQLIIQDHTWNRYLFYAWSNTAPVVNITNQVLALPADASSVLLRGTSSSLSGTMIWRASTGASGSFVAKPVWSATVPLTTNVTLITVIMTNSAGVVGSDTVTITRQVLSPPAIVPLGGTFTNSVTVTLAAFTTNTAVHYSLTGIDSDGSAPLYSAPFLLASNATLKARAIQTGMSTSVVVQASFTVQVATPVFTPPGGTFGESVSVSVTCATTNAQIHYTLDGSEPTTSSSLYTVPILLDSSVTVKAKAFSSGSHESATATAAFTGSLPQAAAPVLTPAGGVFSNAVTVTVTCTNAGAEIRYTTDGTGPQHSSLLYAGGFSLTNSAVVKARAFAAGLAGSPVAAATFTLLRSWKSAILPETSSRDRHVALGTDGGTNLFFTRGASANAGFYRIPKGETTGWTTLAPVPLPATVDDSSGVGNMSYCGGALWTLARNNDASSARCVYRYGLAANTWTKGSSLPGDGPNAAIMVVATNRIFGGWIGWDAIRMISDWQAGTVSYEGNLGSGASHPWAGCVGTDHVYFLTHNSTVASPGMLASFNSSGAPSPAYIAGLPFNPGMGCAVEFIPSNLFPDGHNRLYVLSGGAGTGNSDGGDWTTIARTNQLAIYDLVAQTWSLATLPFAVDQGSEMCLVDDTLYFLAANSDSQPLKLMVFTSVWVPPIINPDPLSRTIVGGTTATFTSGATGTPVPTLSWLKNHALLSNVGNVSGATTSTLTVSNVHSVDAGSYQMVATSVAGAATSQVAVLNFTLPVQPQMTVQQSRLGCIMTWPDPNGVFSLFTATDVAGPYSIIGGATNPYTNPITEPARFFLLKWE